MQGLKKSCIFYFLNVFAAAVLFNVFALKALHSLFLTGYPCSILFYIGFV